MISSRLQQTKTYHNQILGHLLIRGEAIVIAGRHVAGELTSAAARRHCFRNTAEVIDLDHSLDLLLVDIEDSVVCDGHHTFLRPLKLVNFLQHACVNERVY